MFTVQEFIPLRPKTTLRIGGKARWYAELHSKEDCEEAFTFTKEKNCPLIVLGGGSNTIFADGTINALVVRLLAQDTQWSQERSGERQTVCVEAGKNLPNLVNELAEKNLDLSPLTGIPGTVGGAIFGNAGQGFGGIWIGNFVKSVEVFVSGTWKTFTKDDCAFGYRTSAFKDMRTPIIWKITLSVPSRPAKEIQADIEALLKRRLETQPHVKTAGSCFLSLDADTPAWKLIDAAGFRGHKIGGIKISEKHANFLINEEGGTFEDAVSLTKEIRNAVVARHTSASPVLSPSIPLGINSVEGLSTGAVPLQVEMRFVDADGYTIY